MDNVKLSFGNLIAHFIPGVIVSLALAFTIHDWKEIMEYVGENAAVSIFFLSVLSLCCGLLLDVFRYLITRLPNLSMKYKKWARIDFSKANEDDRKYHDWVIENHFRYHQFYGNMALGMFFSGLVLSLGKLHLGHVWALYVLGVVCAIASSFTFCTTISQLRKRFVNSQEGTK
jgi:hypothetical protein